MYLYICILHQTVFFLIPKYQTLLCYIQHTKTYDLFKWEKIQCDNICRMGKGIYLRFFYFKVTNKWLLYMLCVFSEIFSLSCMRIHNNDTYTLTYNFIQKIVYLSQNTFGLYKACLMRKLHKSCFFCCIKCKIKLTISKVVQMLYIKTYSDCGTT